jgi:hypothetical protein
VKDALEHESFQRICDIHQEMTKGGRENFVPKFLLEMVDGQNPMCDASSWSRMFTWRIPFQKSMKGTNSPLLGVQGRDRQTMGWILSCYNGAETENCAK